MAIQNTTNSLLRSISHFINVNTKPIFMALSFLVLLIGLFFAHKLWMINTERSAQYDFSALITEYETMSREKDVDWSALLEKFESNYAKHSGSLLLPYYLGYKAQILLAQDKKEEAIATLDKIIADIPASSLLAMYQMERALIQLDIEDNVGLQALQTLAQDTNNIFRDSAQYYLGSYYWANNQIEDARAIWQQLVDEQRDEKMAPSPWVAHVQEKLALTIV